MNLLIRTTVMNEAVDIEPVSVLADRAGKAYKADHWGIVQLVEWKSAVVLAGFPLACWHFG